MWSLWDREKLITLSKWWLDTYIANTCKRVNWDWQIQSNLITKTLSKITLSGAHCNLNFQSPPPFSHFCLIHIQMQFLKFVKKFFLNQWIKNQTGEFKHEQTKKQILLLFYCSQNNLVSSIRISCYAICFLMWNCEYSVLPFRLGFHVYVLFYFCPATNAEKLTYKKR